jgi:hypothetical protein
MSQQQRFLHQKRLRKPDYTINRSSKMDAISTQMIADGATFLLKLALESISWVDCEIDRELQMRNLYSVSVFCIQFHIQH